MVKMGASGGAGKGQERDKNGGEVGNPKMDRKSEQNGAQKVPKWSQNGTKMESKWRQNGLKMKER